MKEEHGELLTIQEAAEVLSVSTRTIFNRIKKGELTPIKKEGRTYLEADQVFESTDSERPSYDSEKHVLIDREAYAQLMKLQQQALHGATEMGFRIGQLEAEKRMLAEQVKLLEAPKEKKPWWKKLLKR